MSDMIPEETKKNIKSNAIHYWYVIVIVVMLAFSVFQWQDRKSTKADLTALQAKVNITEDIRNLEQKLTELKEREALYPSLEESNRKLLDSIIALEKERKKLEKKNKEILLNEIKKLDEAALVATFRNLGITGTVSECSP